jgi:hypothetical protein
MKFTPYVILLGIAGALFVLAALRIGIAALDFTALGLAFLAGAFVVERVRGS